MDVGRTVLTLARAYVGVLVLLGAGTLVWLFLPGAGESPYLSGLWFALGGFGVLVALTLALVHYSR